MARERQEENASGKGDGKNGIRILGEKRMLFAATVVSLLGFLCLGLEFLWNALLGKGVCLGSFLIFLLDKKRHLGLRGSLLHRLSLADEAR